MTYLRIKHDPDRLGYNDLALMPVTEDEVGTRELFQTTSAQTYLRGEERLERARRGEPRAGIDRPKELEQSASTSLLH